MEAWRAIARLILQRLVKMKYISRLAYLTISHKILKGKGLNVYQHISKKATTAYRYKTRFTKCAVLTTLADACCSF